MKGAVVAVGILSLVCRGPVEPPAAQARPTAAASPVTAATSATSPPATATSALPTGTTAPEVSAPLAGTQSTSLPAGTAVTAALAAPGSSPLASAGAEASANAQRRVPAGQVETIEDDTAVLLAPVVGSPAAGRVPAGTLLTVDRAVFGEAIEGSPDWYFVTHNGEPTLRGFVHVSRVRPPA